MQRPLFADTVAALLRPRRLVPILAIAVPLVVVQAAFSYDPMAALVAVIMVLAFLLVGPWAWRTLFPLDRRSLASLPLRIVAYLGISGILVLLVGWLVPRMTGLGATFLTNRWSLLIDGALFVVGGWGLGRDIELEQAIERERRRARELEREAEHAQLLAIRTHLDPHFLFNTLNAIAEWCREDGEVAERATLELSRMLRTVLSGVRARAWPLERELGLVDTLFDLHLFRDPELFTVVRRVPEPLPDVEVPPMVLLPLAENAIKHGPAAGHRGEVRLLVERRGETLRVVIDNPGPFAGRREGGEGIAMAEKRLALAYDGQASCEVRGEGRRTVAEVVIPMRRPGPEVNA